MTSETESEIKSLKEELQRIEKELLAAISIRDAAQSTNHMCVATSEKNVVSSLDIRYSVFSFGKLRNYCNRSYPFLFLLIVNWLTAELAAVVSYHVKH